MDRNLLLLNLIRCPRPLILVVVVARSDPHLILVRGEISLLDQRKLLLPSLRCKIEGLEERCDLLMEIVDHNLELLLPLGLLADHLHQGLVLISYAFQLLL